MNILIRKPSYLTFFLSLALACGFAFGQENEIVRVERESTGADCAKPCKKIAVIFVHGLTGSQETWENPETKSYWPRLLATDPVLKESVEVYRVDYDSFLFKSGPSFVDVLTQLSKKLDELLFAKDFSNVVMIGHSLGGNVARAYQLHIKTEYGHRPLSAFGLTFTLGTPMQGSDLAPMAKFVSSNQQLRVLLPIRVNDFQQLLNASLVSMMNKHQATYCSKLALYAAFEEKKTGGVKIVPEESATLRADEKKGFPVNHIDIAKPANRDDELYKWVAAGLDACVKGTEVCERRVLSDCGAMDGRPDSSANVISAWQAEPPVDLKSGEVKGNKR